jgi:Arc/MetJ-type ribon-helix-helix transcriptional regulator
MPDTLPEDLQQFVSQELATGRYDSTQDLLIAGLRLLQRDRAEAAEGVWAGLRDMEAGRFQPLDEAFDELRRTLSIPAVP